jgi:pullulanase
VHLLPVFDLATVPEAGCINPAIPAARARQRPAAGRVMALKARDCFNWGYDPCTSPHPRAASPARAPATSSASSNSARMVQALHRMGLRVGMDVVYNHTSAVGPGAVGARPHRARLLPPPERQDGEVERSTCCDNTATEHR